MGYKQYSTRAEMTRDGWKFSHEPELANCRQCGTGIEWAKSPKGKSMPFDPGSTAVHFDTCGKSNGKTAPQSQNQQLSPSVPVGTNGQLLVRMDRKLNQTAPQQSTSAAVLKQSVDELTIAIRALIQLVAVKRRAVTAEN